MYKAPIEILTSITDEIHTQITQQREFRIMAAVNEVIKVDKEELIKALNYDRQQYKKGIEDGKRVLERVCRHRTLVMTRPEIDREYRPWCSLKHQECYYQCLYEDILHEADQ